MGTFIFVIILLCVVIAAVIHGQRVWHYNQTGRCPMCDGEGFTMIPQSTLVAGWTVSNKIRNVCNNCGWKA